MHRGRLHGEDGLAAVLLELMIDRLGIVVVAVGEACEGTDADDVAVAAHHGDGLQQMLALVAVHDDATFRLQLPRPCIDVEHDDVHAKVHGCLLRREARAQTIVEEHHEQGLVLAQRVVFIAVGLYLLGFNQCLLQVAQILNVKETLHKSFVFYFKEIKEERRR